MVYDFQMGVGEGELLPGLSGDGMESWLAGTPKGWGLVVQLLCRALGHRFGAAQDVL